MSHKTICQFGIELECEVSQTRRFSIGGYHDGRPYCLGWEAEEDGSLRARPGYRSVEFVSAIFKRDNLPDLLKRIRLKVKDTDRLENLRINDTCGLHIHFSALHNGQMRTLDRKISHKHLQEIHKEAERLINERAPHLLPNFKRHYYRSMAEKTADKELYTKRYQEFNPSGAKAMEWRSFHARGVQTWADLETLIGCGLDAIETVICGQMRRARPFAFNRSSEFTEVEAIEEKEARNYNILPLSDGEKEKIEVNIHV